MPSGVKRRYLPENLSSLVFILLLKQGPDGLLESKARHLSSPFGATTQSYIPLSTEQEQVSGLIGASPRCEHQRRPWWRASADRTSSVLLCGPNRGARPSLLWSVRHVCYQRQLMSRLVISPSHHITCV